MAAQRNIEPENGSNLWMGSKRLASVHILDVILEEQVFCKTCYKKLDYTGKHINKLCCPTTVIPNIYTLFMFTWAASHYLVYLIHTTEGHTCKFL